MAPKTKSDKKEKNYVIVSVSTGDATGTYRSRSGPAAAARKAANRRFGPGVEKIRISIRETKTSKEFTYDVERVKLPTPFVSTIDGKEIKREYTTKIKAVKKAPASAKAAPASASASSKAAKPKSASTKPKMNVAPAA